MVFALGGGRKRAGRRHNLRARHVRQSRKDHAASSSRPFCPLFYFRARYRARPPLHPLASGAFPMSFVACGCDSPQRRRSTTIDRQPFKIRLLERRFASPRPSFFCADAQCARLSVSMAPWGSYGRLPGETQMTGRLIRACSGRRLRRFGPAGRKKPTRPKPWPTPAPISTNPARPGAPAPIKNQTHLDFSCDSDRLQKEHEQSEIRNFDRRAPQFLSGPCKAARGIRLLGRPAFFAAPRKAPMRHRRFYGEGLPENVEGGDWRGGGSSATIRRAFFGHRRKFPLTIGAEFCRIRISAVGARCGFLAPLGVFPDSSVGRAVDC